MTLAPESLASLYLLSLKKLPVNQLIDIDCVFRDLKRSNDSDVDYNTIINKPDIDNGENGKYVRDTVEAQQSLIIDDKDTCLSVNDVAKENLRHDVVVQTQFSAPPTTPTILSTVLDAFSSANRVETKLESREEVEAVQNKQLADIRKWRLELRRGALI